MSGSTPPLSAEAHFNDAVSKAAVAARNGDADGAALILMAELQKHPGTMRVLTSQLHGDLLIAAMDRDGPGVLEFLDRLVRTTRLDLIGEPRLPRE